MAYLLLVSFIWAFSFGLIKNRLVGLDPTAIGVVRIAFSALVFVPLLRLGGTNWKQRGQLLVTGAVQFGVMYLLYQRSFLYLRAYEVALFTITTPLFIILFDAAVRRKLERLYWLAAALAVAGAGVIAWKTGDASTSLTGLILIQISNACFAAGQLAYRRTRSAMTQTPDYAIFGWLYLGALLATAGASATNGAWSRFAPTTEQWIVLAYLGVLSSGFCFFWWNRGATRVNAGTLAAMNNAKVPLGVACSLLFFHENADWVRLLVGGALLAAGVAVAERKVERAPGS